MNFGFAILDFGLRREKRGMRRLRDRYGPGGGEMKKIKVLLSLLLLLGTFSLRDLPAWAAQGVIYRSGEPSGNYCHLKFPAIRENTLFSSRPVLKDASDGDIVDFYGPCDYDPLGQQEVIRQRADVVRERNRLEDNR
jgi:hypothetical protein